ncbi:MAG TPA: hypothetical protein VJT71_11970 [Pyrinomonadaceae bacterium]|nr:hypothetical protein [Pyrinomonadaceae bacterium]
MSDRDSDELKGKVQKIVTENAKLTYESGKWVEEKRKMNSFVTYDAKGNRVKSEVYDYRGNLFQINEYSFIDGDRVVKTETIRYDYNPPPVLVAPSANKEGSKSRDPRYTHKFKYKYDGKGNRTEEAWYSNDGSLWLRYVSIYDDKGNEVEWFRYTEDGKVNGRSVSSYDAQGNLVEKTWFTTDGRSISEKWKYSYEFDSQGNWIKRNSLKLVTSTESDFRPYDITYRALTYF